MNDQEIVGQIDADNFQHHSTIILSHPEESLVKVALCGKTDGIIRVVQRGDDMSFPNSALPSRLGELNFPHTLLLHCINRKANVGKPVALTGQCSNPETKHKVEHLQSTLRDPRG